MTKNTSLEASHELITEGVVATIERSTMTTETEEDTPLFRKKLQKVLGVRFIAAAIKKDRNLRPLINFVKKGTGRPSKLRMDHIGITSEIDSTSAKTAY